MREIHIYLNDDGTSKLEMVTEDNIQYIYPRVQLRPRDIIDSKNGGIKILAANEDEPYFVRIQVKDN